MLGHAACLAMSTPRINTNATKSTTLTEVREENIMRLNAKFFALFLLVAMGAASRCAQATNLTVNCDRHESLHKALRLLATTNPQGPNKITVLGSCKGNFVIQSMDRLTLITKTGASITDRSSGNLAVLDIEDSQRVTLQGFTINGGAQGILCNTASLCYLTGNTIQGPGHFGINVIKGSRAFLESNVIEDWVRGAFIDSGAQVFSSNDVFQSNGGSALVVLAAAYFESLNSKFDSNGVGIDAGGTLTLNGGTISGNSSDGIRLLSGKAVFLGPTITGNGGVGVHLEDGAFAGFLAASITGNLSGLDVDCEPQFPITRFIDRTGAITNCVEPASKSQLKDLK
jgi:Right handed beta helix region